MLMEKFLVRTKCDNKKKTTKYMARMSLDFINNTKKMLHNEKQSIYRKTFLQTIFIKHS